jgi:hypothetical protein
MDQDFEHLFGPAKRNRLSVDEKEAIFANLKQQISATHRAPSYEGSMLWRVFSGVFSSYTPIAAVVVVLVLVGGGAAVAQNAVPGDFLYPIKRVTERIHSTTRLTPESKADSETSHMDNRVNEATLLQQRGELTEEARVELDNEYRRERREAIKSMQELDETGDEQASALLRARMKATEDRYERLFKGGRTRQGDEPVTEDESSSENSL